MGSSGSTRRITIANDEASGVIKISDAVANRLRGQEEPREASREVTDKPNLVRPQASKSSSGANGVISPVKNLAGGDDKPRKPRDDVVDDSAKTRDNYWREKYRELEKLHSGILKQTTEEFNRGLQTVEELFSNPTMTPICEELEGRVMQCYKDNPQSSLNCSTHVKAFADCVQAFRLRLLAAKG